MSSLFEKSVQNIEEFYQRQGYKLGWRFLNCSKNVLQDNPEIALITLNPGGNTIETGHPSASCESGHSYLVERWGNSLPGQSPLQKQLQAMFAKISEHSNSKDTVDGLINKSLSGYFIPYRSPRVGDLAKKKEAFGFGVQLWANVLRTVQPKLFLCIDRDTYKELKRMIPRIYQLEVVAEDQPSTGWGTYKANLDRFGSSREVTLLRLPHLSTFKLFSAEGCRPFIDDIFREACSGFRKEPHLNLT